ADMPMNSAWTHVRHWLGTAPICFSSDRSTFSAHAMLSSELGTDLRQREFVALVAATAAVSSLAAHARQPARGRKVGLLLPTNRALRRSGGERLGCRRCLETIIKSEF